MFFEPKYDFKDINLIPRVVSTIASRDEIDTSVVIGPYVLKVPIIASPMVDVCNSHICNELGRLGGLGILHRFDTIEKQVKEFQKVTYPVACAIGITGDFVSRFIALNSAGCTLFCLDTANGANTNVQRALEILKPTAGVNFIVGNVASKECFEWLQQFNNIAGCRVSVGSGLACKTKHTTGVYHPTASCIADCASVKKTPLIADGGISSPDDFCKAIALGADCCIFGSLIAATKDSPAKRIGNIKVYRGSASFEIQQKYREVPRYIEGTKKLLEYTGETLEKLVNRFVDGLKSSMSYFNARTIKEFQQNATFN